MFSEYADVYWSAISSGNSPFFSIYIGVSCNFSFDLFKYSTNEINPPSKQNSAFFSGSTLSSFIFIFKPFVKKAISLNLFSKISYSYSRVSKIVSSA